MVYDEATDTYVPISWPDAYALVGRTLRSLDSPHQAAFYTSGRLNNEATFLYQLWVREFGTNNLPDCSNMCHEASGRALYDVAGNRQGHLRHPRLGAADLLIVMGVNAASNAPRMLTTLAKAYRRGAQIIHINPLIEAAARRTIVPHEFARDGHVPFHPDRNHERAGRASAATSRCCGASPRRCLERAETDPDGPSIVDFVERHTSGFDVVPVALVQATDWSELVRQSGCRERADPRGRRPSTSARRPHDRLLVPRTSPSRTTAVDTVREIVNLLLLRGNLGREGAGPVAGARAQQRPGQPDLRHRPPPGARVPRYGSTRCAGSLRASRARTRHRRAPSRRCCTGRVKVFVSMGGNFALAAPDTDATVAALRNYRADRAGEHETQSQPSGPRPDGADPAVPRTHREGRAIQRGAGRDASRTR